MTLSGKKKNLARAGWFVLTVLALAGFVALCGLATWSFVAILRHVAWRAAAALALLVGIAIRPGLEWFGVNSAPWHLVRLIDWVAWPWQRAVRAIRESSRRSQPTPVTARDIELILAAERETAQAEKRQLQEKLETATQQLRALLATPAPVAATPVPGVHVTPPAVAEPAVVQPTTPLPPPATITVVRPPSPVPPSHRPSKPEKVRGGLEGRTLADQARSLAEQRAEARGRKSVEQLDEEGEIDGEFDGTPREQKGG